MLRFRLWLAVLLALSGIIGTLVHAQLTDEEKEKRAQFLKARATTSTSPNESPSPTAKPKTAKHKKRTTAKSSPSETPTRPNAKHRDDEESPTPKPKKSPVAKARKSHRPNESPPAKKKRPKRSPTPSASPKKLPKQSNEVGKRVPAPRLSAAPTPSVTAQPGIARAIPVPSQEAPQVTIEKSGFEGEKALEPPPSPPPRRRFLFWPFSRPTSGESYHYLTRSVIEEIRRAPVQRRRWQLHSDYLNNIALGICLVGDFNRDQPTRAQLECCEELIRYLRQRCGKIDNHYAIVKPHREMNPPRWPTDCPGDAFPYSWFRRF